MADKIVVMRGGHVEQIGSPTDLYDHPNSVFVAGFIGSPAMNFLSATVAGDQLVTPQGEAIGPAPAQAAEGTKITAGIRPEDIRIGDTGIAARVALVEPTGAETQLTLRTPDASVIMTTRDRLPLAPGDTVHFAVEPGKLHRFDAETDRALS